MNEPAHTDEMIRMRANELARRVGAIYDAEAPIAAALAAVEAEGAARYEGGT